jgi:hypothetical protein
MVFDLGLFDVERPLACIVSFCNNSSVFAGLVALL